MKVGDKVYIDGYTSMAQQNARESTIEDIKVQYDKDSGESFNVCLVEGYWFDMRDGTNYSSPDSMYYIDLKYGK